MRRRNQSDTRRSIENAIYEGKDRLGERLAFELNHGRLLAKELGGKLEPEGSCWTGRSGGFAENDGIGAVEGGAGRVFEVLAGGIDDGKVEARLKELHQRVAFDDDGGRPGCLCRGFGERAAEKRQAFGEITLLGAEPEGALRACREKTSAVRARIGAFLPIDGAYMLVRSAVAIFAVARAYAVPVLGDFSRDPSCFGKGRDDVADELGLADAAGVAADNDEGLVAGVGLHCHFASEAFFRG